MWEGQTFPATEENIDINTYTLSKHNGKQSQKNILMKQNFVDVGL
jgi:hypothetical protein